MNRRCLVLTVLAVVLVAFCALAGPASALVRNGAHGWYWQMPQPNAAPGMADVAYAGDDELWTVGYGGLVQRSTDGGRTWVEQPVGTDADLWSVSFVDAAHGLVGGDSAVLTTADGGATWADVTPPAELAPEGIWDAGIATAAHLWVTTADGAVLRSSDGGATWLRETLGAYDGPVEGSFVDARHGFVAGDGGSVWKTTDGGASWSRAARVSVPSLTYCDVAFADARHGWFWGYSEREGEMCLWSTADGGKSWRRSPDIWWIDDLVPTGRSTAFVLSAGFSLWLEPTVVERTTDGGRSWTASLIEMPSSPSALAARGESVCAVGSAVILSGDRGRTWQPASSGQAPWIMDIAVQPGGDLWAADYSGALLRSTDGVRWREQPLPERWSANLEAVTFADVEHGWAVGSAEYFGEGGAIFATRDGGTTWEPQKSNLAGSLSGVCFVDAKTGWAISDYPDAWAEGANTAIERTLDGGETWIPLYVASGASLSAVQFLDADTGWASGSYGSEFSENGKPALFSTANGGFTWTAHKLPRDAPTLTGLQFVSPSEGWAVGTDYDWETGAATGWALHTTDGGTTWTRVDALTDAWPNVVHFIDAGHGYVGGDDGVWSTADGGVTWEQVAPGFGVYALAATDAAHVWAGGSGFLTSTVDGAGDSAAPATLLDDGYSTWSSKDVGVPLVAADIGGSGLAATEYRIDGAPVWQEGSAVEVRAPSDHSNDGSHTVYYRSRDNAGNVEQTEIMGVGIDTLGPACSVYRASTVRSGARGILYFTAFDSGSGVRRAVITAKDRRGRTVLRIRLGRGHWGQSPSPSYFWWPFVCKLDPGTYRLQVTAADIAGNRQVLTGHGKLRVVASGAPRQRQPDWPAGLSYWASGYGGRQAASSTADAGPAMLWRPALAAVQASELPERLRRARLHSLAH